MAFFLNFLINCCVTVETLTTRKIALTVNVWILFLNFGKEFLFLKETEECNGVSFSFLPRRILSRCNNAQRPRCFNRFKELSQN